MKAFLLICTSIKSSILSSLSIVWFDRHELIMNDQAVPLKHEQPEYTEEEGCGCVCVCVARDFTRDRATVHKFLIYINYLFQGCCSSSSRNVRNLKRSIFASMSDQQEDPYTSVNKGPRPYQCWFTACIHWVMMLKQWLSPQLLPKLERRS